jgi:hypothetical protein
MLLYQGSVWFCFVGVSGLTVRWDDGNGFAFLWVSFVGVSDVHVG